MAPSSVSSERCTAALRAPGRVKCRSVLMVGTHIGGLGGVSSVVSGYVEAGLFDRFPCVYVATHRGGSAWYKAWTAFRAWVRVAVELVRLDSPLVHVMLASRASFWRKSVVCLMARAAGRPYLLHVHGGEMMQFYEEESSPLVQRFIRNIYSNASLVLALSEDWRRNLLRIVPGMRVEVLNNAVALPDETRLRRLQTRAPTILALGDLRQRKGTYDLLRAFAQIAARYPRLQLVCAGNGEIEAVRELAAQLEVEGRLSCPGYLSGERKYAELAGATVFVLPSYAEGMPMALLEAMSWGLPVIATRVGGIPQLVEHEVNGLLVEPGDIDGIAAALARLLEDPVLQARLGAAARAVVEERFSVDAAVEHLGRIYRQFGIAEHPTRGILS